MVDQVFVIGTGRCGSTLISNMLRQHPRVTSISEFISFVTDLGCQVGATFPEGNVDGAWFWKLISTAWPRQNIMLRHDVAMDEVLYPFHDRTHRFNSHTGVPAISQVVLPHLTTDPDGWLDALEPHVRVFTPAPVGIQMQRLFEWLVARHGGSVWVERSGGSLRVVHRLMAQFPNARFVHIVRDGRDTALSMSRHRGFKMVFACFQLLEALGSDPFVTNDRRWEEDLPDDLAALLPERFTRQAFLDFETPPPLCGHYWSGEIMEGMAALERLEPERLLTLRYEDFLHAPRQTIRQLIGYILKNDGQGETSFVEQATALVRRPTGSWQTLDTKTRKQLDNACAPGFAALSQHGWTWPSSDEG